MPARFQACVRTLVPYSDGQLRPMWDLVTRNRRLVKTLAAAQEECEKHHRLWSTACEAGGVRALRELFGGKLPSGLPLWARKKMDRRLYAILTDNRPGKWRTDDEDESCTESLHPDASGPGGPIRTPDSSASGGKRSKGSRKKKSADPGARTVSDTLNELRDRIRWEAPYVGRKPYSHNIIRIVLAEIEKKFGRAEANRAVRDFQLERKGFNEEPEND